MKARSMHNWENAKSKTWAIIVLGYRRSALIED